MSKLLILFAKAPEPGKVKTRLTPFISKENAAKLQKAFIIDLLQLTKIDSVSRVIACAPTTNHPFFQNCKSTYPLQLILQEGNELGERMLNAFRWGFKEGFSEIIIIGSDSPTMPSIYIQEAFDALRSKDSVLGPSLDGGYYLIGSRSLLPALFGPLPWGTEHVLRETLEIINREGFSSHLLPFWYDIDRPDDISFLKTHLQYLKNQGELEAKATTALLSDFNVFKI